METDLGSVDEDVQGTSDGINISDVIEVIQTDPDFRQPPSADHQQMTNAGPSMFNGGNEVPQLSPQQQQHGNGDRSQVRVVIREQPAPKALRFRYECEGRSAGSIPGISSTPENKTYPTIEVVGYRGRAVVVVSCVTKDPPYKAHPHNLVGREGCKRGVCTLEFPPETMTVGFQNLGIQCVKRKDIENALKTREEIRVDPFRQGFNHRSQHTSIDLNAVRLCFQVFLEGDTPRRFSKPLAPVVSEPIYDKKAMSDLNIIKLSDCTAPVDGGRKDIILLCEKVAKEDIQVRFYMERNGQVLWEANADFQPSQVHKQHAIWFKPPAYHSKEITEPVSVFIQLRRPSDGIVSEPLPFQYLPFNAVLDENRKKRRKIDDPNEILGHIHDDRQRLFQNHLNIPMDPIKLEPRDSPYSVSPSYAGVSPSYPAVGLSPQYNPQCYAPHNVAAAPSPEYQFTNPGTSYHPPNLLDLGIQENPPCVSTAVTQMEASYNSLRDLNTGNLESSELVRILQEADPVHPLQELNNLQLSDQPPNQNMTESDSLTKILNAAHDNMY